MKRIIFVLLVLLFVVNCSSCSNEEKTVSFNAYKQYDIDNIDFNKIEEIINDIYDSENYIINKSTIYTDRVANYYVLGTSEQAKKNGAMFLDVFQTADIAKEQYEKKILFNIRPQAYKECVIRINNILITGYTSMAQYLVEYCGLVLPKEKYINSGYKKISFDKIIDFDMIDTKLEENELTIYTFEKEYNDSIMMTGNVVVDRDGSSLMLIYRYSHESTEQVFDTSTKIKDTAGTLVKYKNAAFIFLDDFWLDIIKQCEK